MFTSKNPTPLRFLAPATCVSTRAYLDVFARRVRVPLREVGLLPNGTFTKASLREEIYLYAADYMARNAERLQALATTIAADEGAWDPKRSCRR